VIIYIEKEYFCRTKMIGDMLVNVWYVISLIGLVVTETISIAVIWTKFGNKVERQESALRELKKIQIQDTQEVKEACERSLGNQQNMCSLKFQGIELANSGAIRQMQKDNAELKDLIRETNSIVREVVEKLTAHLAFHKGMEAGSHRMEDRG